MTFPLSRAFLRFTSVSLAAMSDPLATFDSLLQEVTKRKPPISASTVESLTKSACKVKVRGVTFNYAPSALYNSILNHSTNP